MKHKTAAALLASVIALSSTAVLSADVSAEWVKSGSSYSYKDDTTGKKLTGWQEIDGGKYYFGKDGKALTGWTKINGDRYYFSAAKKGRMLTLWAKIGGKQYYFGNDGVMRTGWVKLSGKTYYFGNDGVMRTGRIKLDGRIYDFGMSGVLRSETTSRISFWGKDSDGIEDMLDSKGISYYWDENRIRCTDSSGNLTGIYVFDKDDNIVCYGMLYKGDDLRTALKGIEGYGYKTAYSGDGVSIMKSSDSIGVVLYDEISDYTMAVCFSPEYSESMMEMDDPSDITDAIIHISV